MKPRVFVSSVIEDFQDYRKAARSGIIAADGEPILIEDYPGLTISPRNACLDGVASCDILIAIVGKRGGFRAPSGKLVVEEEIEEARRLKLPVLVFVQNVDERDEDACSFVEKLSDYVNGIFRSTFGDLNELQSEVEKALSPLIKQCKKPEVNVTVIEGKLNEPCNFHDETNLRFALAPERTEEFIAPVSLETPELKQQIYDLGHDPKVGLFSYETSKETKEGVNEIIVLQTDEGSRWGKRDEVCLKLTTEGVLIIDINVTGREQERSPSDTIRVFVLLEGDIISGLQKCFAFTTALWDARDPYKRHQRFYYNAALSKVGYRKLVKERPTNMNDGFSLKQHGDKAIIAFDKPNLISRGDLEKPATQVQGTLAMFRRRLKKNSF